MRKTPFDPLDYFMQWFNPGPLIRWLWWFLTAHMPPSLMTILLIVWLAVMAYLLMAILQS
jgi:hypothetical protein